MSASIPVDSEGRQDTPLGRVGRGRTYRGICRVKAAGCSSLRIRSARPVTTSLQYGAKKTNLAGAQGVNPPGVHENLNTKPLLPLNEG